MAAEPSWLDGLRADLLDALAGPPAGGARDPDADEKAMAHQLGTEILAGAQRVVGDPRLADLQGRLANGTADDTVAATVGRVARTLLRWRQQLLRIGGAALRAGRGDEVEAAAEAVLATTLGWNTHPENGLAFLLLGRAAKLRNDLGTALERFLAALDLARDRDAALTGNVLDSLGVLLGEMGRPDDAVAAFDDALAIEPTIDGRVTILSNRANLLHDLGEHRSAAATHDLLVVTLRHPEAPPERLAVALDNAAVAHASLGEHGEALALLDEARALLVSRGEPLDVARNQLSRASVLLRRGEAAAAAAAFADAYQLVARHRAAVDVERYTEGFQQRLRASREAAVSRLADELGDPAAAEAEQARGTGEGSRALQAGLDALHRGEWPAADRLLAEAERWFTRSGAADGVVMAVVNRGVVHMDAGAPEDAIRLLLRAQALAHDVGAARQEMMALANLASLRLSGADVAGGIGVLDLLLQAIAIEGALPTIADALGLEGEQRRGFLWGNGAMDDMLARFCEDHGAHELAQPHWERAITAARTLGVDPGSRFRLANRLANRLLYLRPDDTTGAAPGVVAELEQLVASSPDVLRLQVTGHRALGIHLTEAEPPAAITHLRAAAAAQAELVAQMPPVERAGAVSANPVPYRTLAHLLLGAGDPAGAWAALQGDKGRRVIEALGDDTTPDLSTVQRALAGVGEHAVVVDVASLPRRTWALVVDRRSCRTVGPVETPSDWLADALHGDVHEREARAVEACLRDTTLARLVEEIEEALEPGAQVLLVPDGPLVNLPLHLVPCGARDWGRERTLNVLPAARLVEAFSPATGGRPSRSLVAGDSDGTLPGARDECIAVGAALGSSPLLGPACTVEAVAAALGGGRLDVIHLALHGRGDSARGGRAALRFATADGATWVPFDDLLHLGLDAELVFLSGCSTAIAGPVHGQAPVSAAQAALEAGAGAVIACLWPVDDQAATAFATALYAALLPAWNAGPADLRMAMASARQAVRAADPAALAGWRRDGRRGRGPEQSPAVEPAVADALRWAPFVLFGDPIVAG